MVNLFDGGSASAALSAVRRRPNAGQRRNFQRRCLKHLLKLRAGLIELHQRPRDDDFQWLQLPWVGVDFESVNFVLQDADIMDTRAYHMHDPSYDLCMRAAGAEYVNDSGTRAIIVEASDIYILGAHSDEGTGAEASGVTTPTLTKGGGTPRPLIPQRVESGSVVESGNSKAREASHCLHRWVDHGEEDVCIHCHMAKPDSGTSAAGADSEATQSHDPSYDLCTRAAGAEDVNDLGTRADIFGASDIFIFGAHSDQSTGAAASGAANSTLSPTFVASWNDRC